MAIVVLLSACADACDNGGLRSNFGFRNTCFGPFISRDFDVFYRYDLQIITLFYKKHLGSDVGDGF